jgi:hypothetical protein
VQRVEEVEGGEGEEKQEEEAEEGGGERLLPAPPFIIPVALAAAPHELTLTVSNEPLGAAVHRLAGRATRRPILPAESESVGFRGGERLTRAAHSPPRVTPRRRLLPSLSSARVLSYRLVIWVGERCGGWVGERFSPESAPPAHVAQPTLWLVRLVGAQAELGFRLGVRGGAGGWCRVGRGRGRARLDRGQRRGACGWMA